MQTVEEKISIRSIASDKSILEALKHMDKQKVKLLFVYDNVEKFIGLISIGDLQRSIIQNLPFDTVIGSIIKKDSILSFQGEKIEDVKKKMVQFRTECMPVLNEKGEIIDVHLWEDFFLQDESRIEQAYNIPVVIMAGGKGTRLKPLTNVIPKPLIPIGDKTIIEVIIDNFRKIGSKNFYISVGYKSEMIQFYLSGIDKDYTLDYFFEDKPLGTAGSLYMLKDKIKETFFMSNCDIIVNDDYNEIYKYHQANNNMITLVASLKHIKIPYGTVESGINGELIELKEKPELTYMINTGMYIIDKEAFNYIPEDTFYHITDLIEDLKKQNKKIGVFPVSEQSWTDIGEWPEYQKIIDSYLLR